MKKAMLFFVALLYYTSAAQTILVQETFTNYAGTHATVPIGWYFSYQGNYTSTISSGASGPNSYKFGVNNAVIISPAFNAGIDSLSFWIKGNGTDANSRLRIYESSDSLTWLLSDSIMPLPTTGTIKKRKLLSSTSWLKFEYVKSTGNLAIDDISITSYLPPVASFSMPAFTCVNSSLSLQGSASGNINSWLWDFGNGQTATQQNTSITYTQHGSYRIRLIVMDAFGLSDTVEKNIVVKREPQLGFSYSNLVMSQPTCFTAQCDTTGSHATALQWYWSFHDPLAPNAGSSAQNPCYTYAAAGNYTVCLNVLFSDNGCGTAGVWDSLALPLTIYSWLGVQAGFTFNPVCEGICMPFSDTSISTNTGIVSRNWDFGDGHIDSIAKPCHLYSQAGSYPVTLIAYDNTGSADTLVQMVTVHPNPPHPVIQGNNVCLGTPACFSLQDTSTTYIFHWDFGDSCISALPEICHSYTQAGIYTISCALTTISSCSATAYDTIEVYAPPHTSFIYNDCGSSTICFNGNTVLPVISWQWDFGDGSTSTLPNPQHLYDSAGIYSVCLLVNDAHGCSDTVCNSININTTSIENNNDLQFNLQKVNEGWAISNLPEGTTNKIELIGMEGDCLLMKETSSNSCVLYNNDLPSGVFFIRVSNKKISIVRKIILLD